MAIPGCDGRDSGGEPLNLNGYPAIDGGAVTQLTGLIDILGTYQQCVLLESSDANCLEVNGNELVETNYAVGGDCL